MAAHEFFPLETVLNCIFPTRDRAKYQAVQISLFFRSQPKKKITFEVDQKHASLQEFSSKVEVKFDPVIGRHIVASEDIKPFETVLVEDPVAWVLYPSKAGFNCTHCLMRLKVNGWLKRNLEGTEEVKTQHFWPKNSNLRTYCNITIDGG